MNPMALKIRCAVDDAERRAVFAFRYAVIVGELGVDLPAAFRAGSGVTGCPARTPLARSLG